VNSRIATYVFLAAAVLMAAAAFFPSLSCDFVDGWDDSSYVTENEAIRGFSPGNMKRIFTSGFLGHYCPLVMMSFTAEYSLSGLDPFVYHMTNYVLHLMITALVFWFIRLISGRNMIAFVTAVLFGVHPLQTEVVAWVSERKELLCIFFYMTALISYVFYVNRERKIYYLLSAVFMMLALSAKGMAVTIPVMFLLVDYYYGRRIGRAAILEKLPHFAAAFLFGVINLYFEIAIKATRYTGYFLGRMYFLSKTIFFYMTKLVWPLNLSALYRYYYVPGYRLWEIIPYTAGLIAITVFAVISTRRTRKIFFGCAFFALTILPTMEIIPHGSVYAADRYMYLPSVGIFYIFALFFERVLFMKKPVWWSNGAKAALVCAFILAVCGFTELSRQRCCVWNNTVTLFSDVIKKDPTNSVIPYRNIAVYYERKGEAAKAVPYYEDAVRIRPGSKEDREALMRMYALAGGGAADKKGAEFFNDAGVEFGKKGQYDRAIEFFNEAVRLDGGNAEAYNNLGFVHYLKGDYSRAALYFKKAIEIDPGHEKAVMNLENIRALEGRSPEPGKPSTENR